MTSRITKNTSANTYCDDQVKAHTKPTNQQQRQDGQDLEAKDNRKTKKRGTYRHQVKQNRVCEAKENHELANVEERTGGFVQQEEQPVVVKEWCLRGNTNKNHTFKVRQSDNHGPPSTPTTSRFNEPKRRSTPRSTQSRACGTKCQT